MHYLPVVDELLAKNNTDKLYTHINLLSFLEGIALCDVTMSRCGGLSSDLSQTQMFPTLTLLVTFKVGWRFKPKAHTAKYCLFFN